MLILELRPLFNVDVSEGDWLSCPKPFFVVSSREKEEEREKIEKSTFLISMHLSTKLNYTSFKKIIFLPAVIGLTPTLHRSPPNIDEPHRPSPIAILLIFAPKGGRPWDGKSPPGLRNTFVVFFRFFHFARRFWNQTLKKKIQKH